ncbi:MAG: CobD/CbiB family cobalamin biosynthesis protein [Rhodospirillaceae bacterium]
MIKTSQKIDGGPYPAHSAAMGLFGIMDRPGGFDPLILLLLAMVVEAYAGQWNALKDLSVHPMRLLTAYADWCDRKLNRETRSQTDRAVRGAVFTLLLVLVCVVFGWAVAFLSQTIPMFWAFEALLIMMLIDQRGTYAQVRKIGKALRDDGVETARQSLAPLTSESVEKMDAHNVARTGIEACAETLAAGVLGPVFWYVLFGFPGLLIFKANSILDSRIGRKTVKYRAFGFTAARLNDILLFVPALLSGLFVLVASLFVPTVSPAKSLVIMFRDAGKHRSRNIGWPLAAMAGALGLTLAGPRRFAQENVHESWIGDGTAMATPRDVGRGLYLFGVACLLNGALVGALTAWRLT